ncbi:MAG: putative cytoplasmic protein [Parcubacteria group bacterium]|nr:putative cytoplasmic protein [Parcubacteria group bacterium]
MSLEEALAGKEIPSDVRSTLVIIDVPFLSFKDEESVGQLVLHRDVAKSAQALFATLFNMRFQIEKMVPIVRYEWDDDASMEDNNTSAFNYRLIYGTDRLSNHSFGRAIDINPMQNPYQRRDGTTVPLGSQYDLIQKGTVTPQIAELFKSKGWSWGGDWNEIKDWQHLEKLD